MGPTGKAKIVQIHPTRLCNLQCLHCYSLSGPHKREELDITLLETFLDDAAVEGYNYLAVSGGEPLLYRSLPQLLSYARRKGFKTSLTTNGMLLSQARLEKIHKYIDSIAISLDGIPESHNRMRASKVAFEKMAANLEHLRQFNIPFGFIFTLTQYNLNELAWVAAFAVEQGAELLQIHPLEYAGRALETLAGESPDLFEKSFAFLESARVQKLYENKIQVQLDLVNRNFLKDHPEKGYVGSLAQLGGTSLSDLVSPLIVEQDGTVTPLLYGLSKRFSIGNLHEGRLPSLVGEWRERKLNNYLTLCEEVFESETSAEALPYFNWYESIANAGALPI